MDATTMHSTTSLLRKLQHTYPDIRFVHGDDYRWSHTEKTVYYPDPPETDHAALLLHETAHGLLGHKQYRTDIELIAIERDAWQYARDILAPRFQEAIPDETVEQCLDTYRDWMHARSTCPTCSATGLQTSARTYRCAGCLTTWSVNEARTCRLQRHTRT